jgi:hypothetical protein
MKPMTPDRLLAGLDAIAPNARTKAHLDMCDAG